MRCVSFGWMKIGLLVCLFASHVDARVEVENRKDLRIYRFEVDSIELSTHPTLSGLNPYFIQWTDGEINLPAIRLNFTGDVEISVQLGSTTLENNSGTDTSLLSSSPMFPGRQLALSSDQPIYSSDSFTPENRFIIEETGTRQGLRNRSVTIFPIRYHALAKVFEVTKEFVIEIRGEISNDLVFPINDAIAMKH